MTAVYADAEALRDLHRALLTFARRQEDVLADARAAAERAWDELDAAAAGLEQQVMELRYRLGECYAAASQAAAFGVWMNCAPVENALGYTERRLAAVRRRQRALEEAAAAFGRAERRVQGHLEHGLPRAANYVDRCARAVEAACALEVATGLPAAAAVALQLGMPGVVGMVAAAAGRNRGALSRLMGLDGEDLAASLLSQRYGLTPLPFDPPAQGFDRVFRAPGLPLIVAEVKTTGDGRLRLGRPQTGEQGSPAWTAAQAERMIDPNSAAHTPANARIALLVDQLGPENVPVVTLVLNRNTSTADFYLRGRDGEWQLLEGDVPLPEGESA